MLALMNFSREVMILKIHPIQNRPNNGNLPLKLNLFYFFVCFHVFAIYKVMGQVLLKIIRKGLFRTLS